MVDFANSTAEPNPVQGRRAPFEILRPLRGRCPGRNGLDVLRPRETLHKFPLFPSFRKILRKLRLIARGFSSRTEKRGKAWSHAFAAGLPKNRRIHKMFMVLKI